ncbi:MAG: Holliday junction DNA helicase RuvA [Deltaproteobacteria bacterium RIFCSPLOWO2_01_44_7]|nr:MAG: Holliday junction DNA helicase RuvA [Deltaproteobacteria bacterium RIFCSPHIGHO2_01_FULL_43_49]OGQ16211.1 MAG: Holliday junction DNA helicase RuvA [Deltaproteobacteria bacterium RIFCSPHIGHO2_02_FULL_44_53]OGQ29171.1 MAG: Holliday junction DNA helicase RuvA [Deltaproteobacteria bacterium RIFCSPHIGHO2_12_FULL_44_21]OGQ32728.1 MAG: Holliday junction DNA helicase RuvA [Deltaproteobacteria bacterium RIFCSPLOWO2_01_FULL_45_74]OGQ41830.1 MAG: Holliday junction DNA helicase RuvA [Deltaproteobact
MIAHLKGILKLKSTEHIIIDVNGVGYQVSVSLNTFYELPPEEMEVSLHIHTHVREDQLTLFGFLSLNEKSLFQQLIKVSGIGPKSAITLLSGMTPHEMAEAIANGDSAKLKSIPGIGQKTAERILIDLKGKIQAPISSSKRPSASQTYDEALSALTHLGYTRGQAEQSLQRLDWTKASSLETVVKEGLKNLARS